MDEIRRKRLERLQASASAEANNAQKKAATQSGAGVSDAAGSSGNAAAGASGSPQKPPQAPTSSVPAQTNTQKPAPSTTQKQSNEAKPAPKPVKTPSTPANVSTRPPNPSTKSPEQVLGEVLLAKVNSTDSEAIDDAVWMHLGNTDDSLKYLHGAFTRAERLLQQPAKQDVQRQLSNYGVLSCTADSNEPFYGNLEKFLLSQLKTKDFNPAWFVGLLESCNDSELPQTPFIWDLSRVTRTFGFGDPEVGVLIDLHSRIADVPNGAETLLFLPPAEQWEQTQSKDIKTAVQLLASSTTIGILFNLSMTPDKVADLLPVSLQQNVEVSTSELKQNIKQNVIISDSTDQMLSKLIGKFLRKGAHIRRLVLTWFKYLLDINHATTATAWRPDRSNGFHLLLTALKVMLSLADPFVKLDNPLLQQQLAKVNPKYFATKWSYNVSDQTKLLREEDPEFNKQNLSEELNFVTECFFITVGLLHFGASAATQALDKRTGSLVRYTDAIEHQQRQYYAQMTAQSMRLGAAGPAREEQLRKLLFAKKIMDRQTLVRKCDVASIIARLEAPEFMGSLIRFSEFLFAFDIHTATGGKVQSAWEQTPPEYYACYPEFFLEAPVQITRFVMQSQEFVRDPSMGARLELAVDASVVFMSSPTLVKNPYLRSKFADIMFLGGTDIQFTNGSTMPGPLSAMFTASDTCREYLLPALMSAFIDIEHTGRSSQFYEKFSVRSVIARVMKVMWRDPYYSKQLTQESEQKPEFFVKFVALLLNDATYVLDEALSKLSQVNKLQNEENAEPTVDAEGDAEMRDGNGNGAGTNHNPGENAGTPANNGSNNGEGNENEDGENEDEEEGPRETSRPEQIKKLRTQARDYLALSSNNIDILRVFSSSVPHIFATREIVDRFAVMLNYNLAALVGPRCRELRVENPSEIGFNPRYLLKDVVEVYLGMRQEQPFPKALSKDERSYSPDLYRRAVAILKKTNVISPVDLDHFAFLAKQVYQAWQETQEEEEDIGDDVPDEYLDPLMFTLMEDPVTLPTSRVNIDLSTIKSHLLNDSTDPFNRVPLKIEEVIPNHELKKEIEEFVAAKRQAKRGA